MNKKYLFNILVRAFAHNRIAGVCKIGLRFEERISDRVEGVGKRRRRSWTISGPTFLLVFFSSPQIPPKSSIAASSTAAGSGTLYTAFSLNVSCGKH